MRCFVALWPPLDTATHIKRSVDRLCSFCHAARRVATDNVHLTLSFIGSLPPQKGREVADALAQIAPDQFPQSTWILDRIGIFKAARVLWLSGAHSPTLDTYLHVVQSTLKRLHVRFDTRPFVPHVTVLRHVPPNTSLPQLQWHIPWSLSRPQLMESVSMGGATRYQAVQ